jgi:hypothetical protein
VAVVATDPTAVDPTDVQSLGGQVETTAGRLVSVSVPSGAVDDLRAIEWVESARLAPVSRPTALSEGVRVTRAARVHDTGVTGENVTVGVLDRGFDTSNANVSRGLIEARTFNTDLASGADHGTAVAETVAETAPDAGLYLAAFEGPAGFGNAVDYLRGQDVDVIVAGVSWLYEPSDGTGGISRVAGDAVADGIVWVNPAGNYGRSHWEGRFSDPGDDGNTFHNFAPNDEVNNLRDPDGGPDDFRFEPGDRVHVVLEWDDWPSAYADGTTWRQQSADLDLYLYRFEDGTETVVASSRRSHAEFGVPIEEIQYEVSENGSYGVAVANNSSRPVGVDTELYTLKTRDPEYSDQSGSLLGPATREEVTTVGATAHTDGDLRRYSSQGPTDDGRRGVDVVAPDGTASDVYAGGFKGTSAAAAHVAGIAALLKGANRSATPAAIDDRLKTSATDLLSGVFDGPDRATGYGNVSALEAIRPYLSVSGRLRDATGTPIDGRVSLRAANGTTIATVGTDSDGAFDLPTGAAPGTVTVDPNDGAGVTLGDGVPDVYTLGRLSEPVERRQGEIELPDGSPVRVRVVTDQGVPVRNATVTVVHRSPTDPAVGTARNATAERTLRTNASGVALVGGDGPAGVDAAGDVQVRVDLPDGSTLTRSRTVTSPWNLTVTTGTSSNISVVNLSAPDRVDRTATANVSVTLANDGGRVDDRTQVALRIDADGDGALEADEEVAVTTVEVPAESTRTATLQFTPDLPPGRYDLGVRVGGTVSPFGRSVTVETTGPYVRVSSLSGPREVVAGDRPAIDARLENAGKSSAVQLIDLRVDADGDGVLENSETVDGTSVRLMPNESRNVTLVANTSGLATDDYRYGVVSANTSATDVMRVRQPANLSVELDVAGTVARGDRLTANLTVTNAGGLTWDGPVELRLDTDGDGRSLPNETVASELLLLDPGETTSVELAAPTDGLALRSYRVEAVAADETVEGNVTVEPAPPNFTVEYFGPPGRINRTDSRRVLVGLENQGGIRGRPWAVELWLDRNHDGRFVESERLDAVLIAPGRGIDQLVRLRMNVTGLDERYYTVAVTAPNVTRTARVPAGDPAPFPYGIPGGSTDRPPTDVDDDGLVEDLDGDGRFTFVDIVEFAFADFATINRDDAMRSRLDFSGDDRVSFVDVVDLVFEL